MWSQIRKTDLAIIVALIVFVVSTFYIAMVYIPKFYGEPNDSSEFGDMFGALNALYSGLAFVGVIYAILLQRRELQLQREELVQTRNELQGQKFQLEAQNKTFLKQTFENTFFQLLRLHIEILDCIEYRTTYITQSGLPSQGAINTHTKIYSGREAVASFYEILRDKFVHHTQKIPYIHADSLINEIYLDFFSDYQPDIGHYFRNLYNIIKFIDESEISDRRFYSNLVRAQLYSSELLLLFYNCLSDLGREKFKPLVEAYALLEDMPTKSLLNISHIRLYEPTAFGGEYPIIDS